MCYINNEIPFGISVMSCQALSEQFFFLQLHNMTKYCFQQTIIKLRAIIKVPDLALVEMSMVAFKLCEVMKILFHTGTISEFQ